VILAVSTHGGGDRDCTSCEDERAAADPEAEEPCAVGLVAGGAASVLLPVDARSAARAERCGA